MKKYFKTLKVVAIVVTALIAFSIGLKVNNTLDPLLFRSMFLFGLTAVILVLLSDLLMIIHPGEQVSYGGSIFWSVIYGCLASQIAILLGIQHLLACIVIAIAVYLITFFISISVEFFSLFSSYHQTIDD